MYIIGDRYRFISQHSGSQSFQSDYSKNIRRGALRACPPENVINTING